MKTFDLGEHSLYKMSHGEAAKNLPGRTMHSAEYFRNNNWIVIHKDTGKKQGYHFIKELEIGDYVYVCYGSNKLSYFAKITSDSNNLPVSARKYVNGPNWVYRRVLPIYTPKDSSLVELVKFRKYWLPSGNSTLWKVPDAEINYFNKVIGIPKYGIKITKELYKSSLLTQNERRSRRKATDLENITIGHVRKTITTETYIEDIHKQIQKGLKDYLISIGSKSVVGEEDYVDLKHSINGIFTFYEIKPYHNPILCMRESIGQLLEYRYFAQETKPTHLIAIGKNALNEESKGFLKELQKQVPEFTYQQFDLKKQKLVL